jgi:hypothetical protein
VLLHARPLQFLGLDFLDLSGSLSSTRGTYRIDIYRNVACDASGHGEGATLLGSDTIELDCSVLPPNQQCSVGFDLAVFGTVTTGQFITATVTSPSGHTSEFSACRAVSGDLIFADGFE